MFYKTTVVVILLLAFSILFISIKRPEHSVSYYSLITPTPKTTSTPTPNPNKLSDPIAEFKPRITKKTFGLYVSPKSSLVSPERFTGFHTGVDVEYEDVSSHVPVLAVSDGKIVYSGYVNGYGGVLVESIVLNGNNYMVLYGHLDPQSLTKKGTEVTNGQQLAILGRGYSYETYGERKHLHLAIYPGNNLNFKGYVSNKDELKKWSNPLDFY